MVEQVRRRPESTLTGSFPFTGQEWTMFEANDAAVEARARRAAVRCGFRALKSRSKFGIDNHGSFRLVDDDSNFIVAGEKFDMSTEDVLSYCNDK